MSEAPGGDTGLPSALDRITILVSEVGCEPLVVGPSAELWTLSLDVSNFPGLSGGGGGGGKEAPWTERTAFTCWFFLMSELGCLTVAGDLLLGCSEAYKLAGTGECEWRLVRKQSHYRVASRLGRLGEILLAVGQGCLAGRSEAGPGSSCWQLVGAFCWVAMRLGWLVGPGEVCSLFLLIHSSHLLVCWPLLLSSSCLGESWGVQPSLGTSCWAAV